MKTKFIASILILLAITMILPASVAQALWDGGLGTGPGGVGSTDGTSNLELWLEGGTGVYTDTTCSVSAGTGNSVACWTDQSGNAINFTQGTSGNRPTFGTSSLNGVNVLRFDGTTDFLNGGNVLDLTQLSVFTVVIPRNVTTPGGDQKIVTRGYDGTNTQWEFGTSGTGTAATNDLSFLAYPSAGATSTSLLTNTTAITGGGSYGTSGWRLWFNGQVQGTSANPAPASNTRAAVVGAVSITGGTYAAPTVTQRWNGDIGEVIVFSGQVNSAQHNLVNNYLSAKYNIAMLANDLYTGNDATYYRYVAGIGQESDGDNTEAHSAGLVLQESGGSLADGEYVLGGYASTTNGTVTTDLPTGIASRWTRDWYVDKTGTVDVTLSFDFSEGGIGGTPSGGYVLLYRSGTSGNYSVVNLSTVRTIAGDRVQFNVPNASLSDGYYTLGIDSTAPTATIDQAVGQDDPTGVSPINFLVTFDEPIDVASFTSGDITTGGTATGTLTVNLTQNNPPNDGTSFNVAVSGMTGDGTVTIGLAAGEVQDLAGNANGTSTVTDDDVTYDTSGPTATIDQAVGQDDPTNGSPINFLVTFDEPIDVASFTSGDITTGGTATGTLTVNLTQNNPPNDGTSFNVAVSGMTGDGTVTIGLAAGEVQDLAGNDNGISTVTDDDVTYDTSGPTATIDQAVGQDDPTNGSPINFLVTFDEPIDVASFTNTDITLSGTAGATSVTISQNNPPNNGTSFNVAVSGMAGNGTVIINLPSGRVQDLSANNNQASVNTDNEVTFDTSYPVVINAGVVGQPDALTIINNGSYTTHFTHIEVTFSKEVFDPTESNEQDDVTNQDNYLLIQAGVNEFYDTLSCAGGRRDDDIQIPTGPVEYNNTTHTARVRVNNGTPLPSGEYRLFICGTRSIVDLAGNLLNGGDDEVVTFSIFDARQPSTGFAPGVFTRLPTQSVEKAYNSLGGVWLEIPVLKVKSAIVGVPAINSGWDTTWLNNSIGWLDGTAFPSWNGNSVLTAHVYDYNGLPGPFAGLKDLRYGDLVIVHAFGQKFTFAVRNSIRVSPAATTYTFQHLPNAPYLTLVTCEGYVEASKSYTYRRVVRLVLADVQDE